MAFSQQYGGGYHAIHVNKQALAGGVGGGLGVVQAVGVQTMDATGQWPVIVPQLGGFGTTGGVINLVTGTSALVAGVAGAMGKGPVKNHPAIQTGAITYGATALLAQTTAAVLNTAAVRTPYVIMAARNALQGATGTTPLVTRRAAASPTGTQSSVMDTFA